MAEVENVEEEEKEKRIGSNKDRNKEEEGDCKDEVTTYFGAIFHRNVKSSILLCADEQVGEEIEEGYVEIAAHPRHLQEFLRVEAEKPYEQLLSREDTLKAKALQIEEHKKFMESIISKRRAVEQRRKRHAEAEQRRISDELRKEEELEREREQRVKLQRKKCSQGKIEEQRRRKEQGITEREASERRLAEATQKRRVHEILEEKYRKGFVLPALEKDQKKLQQIRELSRAFNIEDIKQHEKEYIRRREQHNSNRETEEWHYQMPKKSDKLLKMLEEEKIQTRIDLEHKKRTLEERISRQENFVLYLKEKFPVRIDTQKRAEIQAVILQEQQRKNRPSIDVHKLGNSYMEAIKEQHPRPMRRESAELKKDHSFQSKPKSNSSIGYYHQEQAHLRRRQLERLISAEGLSKDQKLGKLKRQVEILGEESERLAARKRVEGGGRGEAKKEEEVDLLLSSIRAKIGIIGLYRNN